MFCSLLCNKGPLRAEAERNATKDVYVWHQTAAHTSHVSWPFTTIFLQLSWKKASGIRCPPAGAKDNYVLYLQKGNNADKNMG